jgi:ELWxxDGT repeat protein
VFHKEKFIMSLPIKRSLVRHLLISILAPILVLILLLGYIQAASSVSLVKDINPDGDASLFFLTDFNGALYFFADDGEHGRELWKSDGTATGTVLVKDINPTGDSIFMADAIPVHIGNTLYFAADDGIHGIELWKSDGTMTGTVMVKDINPDIANAYPGHFVTLDDVLYFGAVTADHGFELWRSDGTMIGTTIVKDIWSGPDSALTTGFGVTNVDGILYFRANNGSTEGLWKSDGTLPGTVMVTDITPALIGEFEAFISINNVVYFEACPGLGCFDFYGELWKTDGTATGTVRVKAITVDEITDVNNTLFFRGDDGLHGWELWKSDGTMTGTVMVKDINPNGSTPPNSNDPLPIHFTNVDGVVFFAANDGSHGLELWKSDGTVTGTIMVKDINPNVPGSSPTWLINVNGVLYFRADDGAHGAELWQSDGTEAGTFMIADINPTGGSGSDPLDFWLTQVNEVLFFGADDGTHGAELWKLSPDNGTPPTQTYLPVIIKGQ